MAMKVQDTDPRVSAMAVDWSLIEALLGGTRAMRAAGQTYLPKWSLETQSDYDARLALATLFPALGQTLREMKGRAFGEPVSLGKDVPKWIEAEVWPDIDRQGNNGHVFAAEWWLRGLSFGLSHVLVDAPSADGIRTQADQRKADARPFCIQIAPQRVLGWKVRADGRLGQLRLTWSRTEPGDFGDAVVPQIRVYDCEPGASATVRTFERPNKDKDEWVQIGPAVVLGVDFIPLATFYTGRTGLLTAEPPFRELAELNRKHWAHQCGADALLETAMVPVLAAIGIDPSEHTIAIGGKSAIALPLGADMKYVEHSGKAIGSGLESLEKLEAQMKAIGAKLVEPGGATKTATQAGEEAASSNSTLGGWVNDFQDALAVLLDMIAAYRGEATGGRAELNADLDPDTKPVESMQVLSKMRAQGDLSGETLFREGQRRGLISPEIEWEDEQARIETEGPKPAEPDPAAKNTGGAP